MQIQTGSATEIAALAAELESAPGLRARVHMSDEGASTWNIMLRTLQPRRTWQHARTILDGRQDLWASSLSVISSWGGGWGRYVQLSDFGTDTDRIDSIWLGLPPTPRTAWT